MTNRSYLPNTGETKAEYLERMEKFFNKIGKAQKKAERLAKDLANIREKGFKVTIRGETATVTY